MNLSPYVENLRRELAVASEAGGEESRALAERLSAALESATRLTLLDALTAASDEITRDMAPGSVYVRLRGRDAEFVVTPPPAPHEPAPTVTTSAVVIDSDDTNMVRINLRLPEQLKQRVEEAAGGEGMSVNAWLVRAATAALDPGASRTERKSASSSNHFSGWVR